MKKENEVITFKADKDLLEAMNGITNRSAFIRQAILAALDNTCPVCGGIGVLTPNQRTHWAEFTAHHHMEKCQTCSEMHVVCDADSGTK
ncbi:MAG: CopG family transcriptional regulator [Spirochaetales bacterium]|nr:CopG family transcriptional regulator [Spirochaetales bacterium]